MPVHARWAADWPAADFQSCGRTHAAAPESITPGFGRFKTLRKMSVEDHPERPRCGFALNDRQHPEGSSRRLGGHRVHRAQDWLHALTTHHPQTEPVTQSLGRSAAVIHRR